jgi:hypothetical protein
MRKIVTYLVAGVAVAAAVTFGSTDFSRSYSNLRYQGRSGDVYVFDKRPSCESLKGASESNKVILNCRQKGTLADLYVQWSPDDVNKGKDSDGNPLKMGSEEYNLETIASGFDIAFDSPKTPKSITLD